MTSKRNVNVSRKNIHSKLSGVYVLTIAFKQNNCFSKIIENNEKRRLQNNLFCVYWNSSKWPG